MKRWFQFSSQYSLITFTPIDPQLKSSFWDFRLEDIRYVFLFKLGYSILLFLYALIDFVRDADQTSFFQMLLYSLFTVLHVVTWMVGMKKAKFQIYLIVSLFPVFQLIHYTVLSLKINQAEANNLSFEEYERVNFRWYAWEFHIFCALFAPGLAVLALVYIPLHALSYILFMFIHYGDENKLMEVLRFIFIQIMIALFAYTILQTRELKRFFQQQELL